MKFARAAMGDPPSHTNQRHLVVDLDFVELAAWTMTSLFRPSRPFPGEATRPSSRGWGHRSAAKAASITAARRTPVMVTVMVIKKTSSIMVCLDFHSRSAATSLGLVEIAVLD